ncbi:DUF2393 family protein [Campylobacter sp. RM9344]|uniref:DUF2393 family protein n=1 Tax=Campylobacter californiensis TaxID=1032243 RepID=A0AAW3ZQP1_9BACT|nr:MULTISPECIES: DUF2393 family protein [unclassified Campylobacter]MBE2984633.1 DUF2393 family protein [Campylobacter sp. RM6883]MBE2986825.1 DUF2393 family protein [Campylobacter sp. RM12919]MBE2988497.1 DUF2393 family protein [Campylobacter sp. RM12920]MBE2995079.1 DUF2393 family protein [Campylobacter sp. RM6913]MBE3029000.1 DUF2393 family protein [Campylobacter sp. RM9344]
MSASYFTIVHIIVLCIILLLCVLFFILSLKAERKLFLSLCFTNILVSVSLSVFLMLVLDKYTKIGILENVTNERILRNESIVFKGQVRNIGKFTISKCVLKIKLINQPLSKDNLSGEALFKPSGMSLFSWLLNEKKDTHPNTVEYSFEVAKDLKKKKSASFTVNMPYPPYFTRTMHVTKLNCY